MRSWFRINDIEKGYYADGEDAYDMRKNFKKAKKIEQPSEEAEPPAPPDTAELEPPLD